MGVLSCENCRAIVHDKVAICPSCGEKVFARGSQQLMEGAFGRQWHHALRVDLIAQTLVCAAAVVAVLFASWWIFLTWAMSGPDPVEKRARKACESALRIGSLDGGRIAIPQSEIHIQDGSYRLRWAAGQGLTMPNGYGANFAASASCIYEGSSGTITSLRVNGKSFP